MRYSTGFRASLFAYSGLAAVLLVFIHEIRYFWHYLLDDAYITLRYSYFLATGNGPYFNHGEHVEGYTNFLFMLILALVIRYLGPEIAPAAGKALSATFGVLAIALAFVLVRRLLRRWHGETVASLWALAAAAIPAVHPGFAINSTSGLETTLLSVGLVGAVLVSEIEREKKRWLGSGVVWSAVVLTRPEGSLLFAVHWLAWAGVVLVRGFRTGVRDRSIYPLLAPLRQKPFRLLWINAFLVTAAFLAHMSYRIACYDGEWLPNTYYAKSEGYMGKTALAYIGEGLLPFFLGLPGIALALWGLARRRDAGRRLAPLATLAATGCLLPLVTGSDWMFGWRLVVTYLPLASAAVVMGWSFLLEGLSKRRPWVLCSLLIVYLPGLWIYHESSREDLWRKSYVSSLGFRTGHQAFARWLCGEKAGDEGPVALMDIGLVGYSCIEREIVDITGLTDRHIGKSPGRFLAKQYDVSYILRRRPKFVALIFSTGTSTEKTPPIRSFHFWTGIEGRIYRTAEFQEKCVRPDRKAVEGLGFHENLARKMGAEKVFSTGSYPGSYYALTVFRCRFGSDDA